MLHFRSDLRDTCPTASVFSFDYTLYFLSPYFVYYDPIHHTIGWGLYDSCTVERHGAHAEWHGARTMEHGALGMVQGACCKGHGAWKHGACAGWHNAIPLKS